MKDYKEVISEFLDELCVESDNFDRRVIKYICVLRAKIKELEERLYLGL